MSLSPQTPSPPIQLDQATFYNIDKTQYTRWTFGRITDTQARSTLIELNGGSNDKVIANLIHDMIDRLKGQTIVSEQDIEGYLGISAANIRTDPRDRVLSCAVSALRTAVFNLQAQARTVPVATALGSSPPAESVPLYANLNRSIQPSFEVNPPTVYADAAEFAVAEGFSILKCAPFEEVQPDSAANTLQPGLDRIDAIQAAVGSDVELLVDCHSRFDREKAIQIGYAMQERGIGWYEEPLDVYESPTDSSWLKGKLDIPIAGGESGYGIDFFQMLLEHQAVDIIMPDVKYCGGILTAWEAGQMTASYDARISLHSPTGPVCALASAHVSAVLPDVLPLEYAPLEVPWRGELLEPAERVEKGRLYLPHGPGLGADLNPITVDRYGTRWER